MLPFKGLHQHPHRFAYSEQRVSGYAPVVTTARHISAGCCGGECKSEVLCSIEVLMASCMLTVSVLPAAHPPNHGAIED